MQTISAANNTTIQTDSGLWRLFNAADSAPLIEATRSGLTYPPAFARSRNLPDGMLPVHLIDRVIVGWAVEDSSWQLGVLFTPDYAQERGGRWCGLARWLDAYATLEGDAARMAGQTLAEVLEKPFRFVPAEPSANVNGTDPALTPGGSALPDEAPPTSTLPDVQTLTPPIALGEWALTESRNGLNWEHSRNWRVETLSRVVFFGALTLLFGLLSAGELRTNFAPVQPEWLPLVGVGVALIMAVNTLANLWALLMTRTVEFDRRNRMIRFVRRPGGVVKQVPFEKVEYLLVSQTLHRHEPTRASTYRAYEQVQPDVWIHVARAKGDFLEIGHVAQVEGRAVHSDGATARHLLRLDQIDTPAHQAGLLLANTMEVPAFIEDRA